MSAERSRSGGRNRGCGAGCGGILFVLIVGVILSIFNVVVGVGVSVRVPSTQSNLTLAGSVGVKDKVLGALPDYVQGRLGRNQNFFNNSTTITIGPAEGAGLLVIGKQEGAPAIDLHLFLH